MVAVVKRWDLTFGTQALSSSCPEGSLLLLPNWTPPLELLLAKAFCSRAHFFPGTAYIRCWLAEMRVELSSPLFGVKPGGPFPVGSARTSAAMCNCIADHHSPSSQSSWSNSLINQTYPQTCCRYLSIPGSISWGAQLRYKGTKNSKLAIQQFSQRTRKVPSSKSPMTPAQGIQMAC